MTQELLRQVRLLDPQAQVDHVVDVLIADGTVAAIAPQIAPSPSVTLRDGVGLVLGPGLVDLYSYSGEPGFEARETLSSLARAGAAGGFTRLSLLPDTQPALDTPDGLQRLQAQLPSGLPVRVQAWGAITQALAGERMVAVAELAEAGVLGFSDGRPLQNLVLLRRLLEYAAPFGKPIALWPLQPMLVGKGVVREGEQALRLGLPECPTIAETVALAAILEVVTMVPTPVHLMRVSTARSVALIAAAKAQGLPITASTTWMHLLWNSEALTTYDSALKLDPPVGNPEDQAALVQGVKDGVIDAIAIDHRSYTFEEKTVAFGQAPPGAIGLEIALPLLWQTFVASGQWTALELWSKLSTLPAQCLQQAAPSITVGQPAEMMLFDPHQQWNLNAQSLNTLGQNSPWFEQDILGKTIKTWWRNVHFSS